MDRRQFIKGMALGTGALVLGVDWAAGKDVSEVVEWTKADLVEANKLNAIEWKNKTSDEIINDVEVMMNGLKCEPWDYKEIIV